MGSELVTCIVPVTRTQEEAIKRLHEMTDEELISRLQFTHLDWEHDEELYNFADAEADEPNSVNRAKLMPFLEDAVNLVYSISNGDFRRSTSIIRFGDCRFAMAGGDSWGDAPPCFDELTVALYLGVTFDDTKTLKWVD